MYKGNMHDFVDKLTLFLIEKRLVERVTFKASVQNPGRYYLELRVSGSTYYWYVDDEEDFEEKVLNAVKKVVKMTTNEDNSNR